ncbi:MAG: hypothetical protein R6V12_04720 [Candidatus Hydrogenedentota bacterium]
MKACSVRFDRRANHLAHRRRAQARPTFRERCAIRAGIEATNSELKLDSQGTAQ